MKKILSIFIIIILFIGLFITANNSSNKDKLVQKNMAESDSLSDDKMMISIYTKGINQEFVKFEIDYNDLILSVVKEKDNKYVIYTNQSGEEEALGSVTITNKDNKKLWYL